MLSLTEPFGFVLDGGLTVRSVLAHSQATRKGVEVGMRVAEVDGVPVCDGQSWDAEVAFVKRRVGNDVLKAHLELRYTYGAGSIAPPRVLVAFDSR